VVNPRNPIPSASPDDDPTGVRALLSAMPEPEPMPEHLVERINASLAEEQAQRAARTSGASVTPLLATTRRRPGRLLFALAGAAAAVALVSVVGNNMFKANQSATTSGRVTAANTSNTRASNNPASNNPSSNNPEASGATPPSTERKAAPPGAAPAPAAARPATPPPLVQIRLSETRYTRADFVTQARILQGATLDPLQPAAVESSGVGPAGTPLGLTDCLSAIGARGAQMVRADVAFYEGRPAVIIVATTNGIPTAYAVGRQCSHARSEVLRPATALP